MLITLNIFVQRENKRQIDHFVDIVSREQQINRSQFPIGPPAEDMRRGMMNHLLQTSAIVAALSGLGVFVLLIYFSKWAVSPVESSMKKQRVFISDSSHELKTPLAIIATNVDILEKRYPEADRIAHIKPQIARMQELIHCLLQIARADEGEQKIEKAEFSLSQAILETALEFESVAYEAGREFSYEIDNAVNFHGNEGQIRQLCGILIDNAVRHSRDGEQVKVSLKNKILTIYNTGEGIGIDDKTRIFDRFYRADKARGHNNLSGGFGLGLSIAQSIAAAHQTKIKVDGKKGEYAKFSVKLG
jgi:signal transduction histidine kinase